MGAGPLAAALPMLAQVGGKLFGGSAQAAPAAAAAPQANPWAASLMGMPGQGGPGVAPQPPAGAPPMPMRNPAFSDPAGDARGAKMIEQQPGMRGMFAEMMSKPRGGDGVDSFESKPTSAPETIWGKDVTGQGWTPPKAAPTPASTAPVQANTMMAQPAEAPQPEPPVNPMPGMEQGFDTSAPKPGGIWGALQGFAADPIGKTQKWGKGVPTNPLAQAGLSFLASGYDGSNPYSGMQKSLGGIPATEALIANMNRANKKDKEETGDSEIRALLAQMMLGQYGGAGQPAATPPAKSKQTQNQARMVR